jgi:hypothetical protein
LGGVRTEFAARRVEKAERAERAEKAEKADQHGESSGDDNNHSSLLFWAAVRTEFVERVEKADINMASPEEMTTTIWLSSLF